MTEMCCWW